MIESWQKPHQHLLDVSSLGAMRWRLDQKLSRNAEEYKIKYLQYGYKKNPQIGMMGSFLMSLDDTCRWKMWE